LDERIAYCERAYEREGLPTIFRLTSISPPPDLDDVLSERGYGVVGRSDVLTLSLDDMAPEVDADFGLVDPGAWSRTYASLAGLSAADTARQAAILGRITGKRLFASLGDRSEPVACGLGVVEDGLIGLFDIVTHPSERRRGHATRLLASLLTGGRAAGAVAAYLQVETENRPAAALYRRFGFATSYHYWYRLGGEI
jgi:ribosomal protein S18 acetylase RimI-like enzyme